MNFFDYIKDINNNKKYLLIDKESEKEYNPFLINRYYSFFKELVPLANEMNRGHSLDKKLQHDFYFYALEKKNRFTKWVKPDALDEDIQSIMKYYKYNKRRALEAKKLLSQDQIENIKKKLFIGGVDNKKVKKSDRK